MRYLADLDSGTTLGGKARSLARLREAGLRTPPGFAIRDALFRALRAGGPPLPERLEGSGLADLEVARDALERAPWPEGFLDELDRLTGERFSVRSSFAGEDDAAALAAGVYESRVDVPRAEVPAAIREVLLSALAPGAVAYALAHGLPPAAAPVAVLVHEHVAGDSGAAALDDTLTVTGTPTATARAEIEAALRALTAREGPTEIEWTASGDRVTFLQMRPYVAPPRPRPWAGFASLPPDELGRWRWDAAHNPLPLSPAQAGLVALVDERCRIGVRQRLLGGYLFSAPGDAPARSIAPAAARAELDALRAMVDARLATARGLEETLELFATAYERLFGVVQPAARAGRRQLEAFLRAHLPEALPALPRLLAGVPSMATERRRLARALGDPRGDAAYLALFGDEAPVWDVAVPTYRERPETLRAPTGLEIAPPEPLFAAPEPLRAELEALRAVARDCVAVGEDDDWLYARLQAGVRRALLAIGARLESDGALATADDIFFLPLALVRSGPSGDLAALARAGREAHQAALADPPPAPAAAPILKGSGTAGRVLGRVRRHRPGAPGSPDAVLVADTLLPTELPLIDAAALVIETGGPLDHVATQARERSLPALVGVAGASHLREGELVLVDADGGVLVRLEP